MTNLLLADECWEWKGARRSSPSGKPGYGFKKIHGKQFYTHRLAWEWANGQAIPSGKFVLHRCDNPPCVNPAHLFLGDAIENVRDRDRKGRNFNASLRKCREGHEFTVLTNGRRRCLICLKEWNIKNRHRAMLRQRKYRAARRAANA